MSENLFVIPGDDPPVTIRDITLAGEFLLRAAYTYATLRGYKDPNGLAGAAWLATEVSEVLEIFLQRQGGWVRNNPDDHQRKDDQALAEELGDVIFMALYVSAVNCVDPFEALAQKMKEKLT